MFGMEGGGVTCGGTLFLQLPLRLGLQAGLVIASEPLLMLTEIWWGFRPHSQGCLQKLNDDIKMLGLESIVIADTLVTHFRFFLNRLICRAWRCRRPVP